VKVLLSQAVSVAVHGPVLTLHTNRNKTEWLDLRTLTFALTDRGAIFDGAALTVILVLSTLVVLWVLSWLSTRARFG